MTTHLNSLREMVFLKNHNISLWTSIENNPKIIHYPCISGTLVIHVEMFIISLFIRVGV